MAVKKASTTQDAQIESGHRWLPELSSDWMRPRHMSLKATGSCNVLVVVPHGFPWNDDNAEILGFHLSQELDAYAVINNRKYVKSPPHIIPRSYPTEKQFHKAMKDRVGIHRQMEDVGGFVADLSLLHEA